MLVEEMPFWKILSSVGAQCPSVTANPGEMRENHTTIFLRDFFYCIFVIFSSPSTTKILYYFSRFIFIIYYFSLSFTVSV